MDKRDAVRIPVQLPAVCRSDGEVIDGFVEDLSRTGLFLRASKPIAAGTAAEIQLQLPGEPPIQLNAEVVRVEAASRGNDGRPGMGLRIVADAEDCRPLANFIMRQHATLR